MNVLQARQKLVELDRRARRGLTQLVARRKDRLAFETKLFASLNYRAVLARGFAVIRDDKGEPLRHAADVPSATQLVIEFVDGVIQATTQAKPKQGSLF